MSIASACRRGSHHSAISAKDHLFAIPWYARSVGGRSHNQHFREQESGVIIEEDATVGPGAIVLPNVTVGRGAIVTAGSVVTKSVPPKTMVQGNPAQPIATVEIPLRLNVSLKEFAKGLRPIRERSNERNRDEST